MTEVTSEQFDFDEWKDLAETDPEAFEHRRLALIEAEINAAPAAIQDRLRGLQWQVDMTRKRYKHPSASSAKLFEMMWDKVYGDKGFLEALTGQHEIPNIAEPEITALKYYRLKRRQSVKRTKGYEQSTHTIWPYYCPLTVTRTLVCVKPTRR